MDLFKPFVRHLFHPLALWRAGELAQLRYLREFERTQHLPPEDIKELQWGRLRAMLTHAYAHCPFYRGRFEAAGLTPGDLRSFDDLRALPPLEKRDIQENGPDLVARDWPRDDLIPNSTGGSTGSPLALVVNRERKCSHAAGALRHNRWAGWEVGDRTAVLWGAPRDRGQGGWRSWLRDRLLRKPLWLDTAHVTEQTLREFHRRLTHYQPRVILAYAGAAILFARFLEQEGLSVPSLRALVTSAEVLGPEDRTLVQRAFDCPVFDRYGCREVSVVASECEAHDGLHVMEEGLYLEIETGGQPAEPGQPGSILVTDLLNFGMPLIRYRIGDVGSWASGTCPCGRGLRRLRQVQGRVTDFLVGGDGRLVSGVFLATYVVASRPSLGQVQIVQDRPGAVLYRIRPGRDFHPQRDPAYLREATVEYLGPPARVEWEVVDELRAEASGKFLFSRSTVAPRFLAQSPPA